MLKIVKLPNFRVQIESNRNSDDLQIPNSKNVRYSLKNSQIVFWDKLQYIKYFLFH